MEIAFIAIALLAWAFCRAAAKPVPTQGEATARGCRIGSISPVADEANPFVGN